MSYLGPKLLVVATLWLAVAGLVIAEVIGP